MSDNGIHCLGNGHLCVYESGPDIVQIFGPPYSCPPLGALTLTPSAAAVSESRREPGAAIWTHRLADAELTDFVDAEIPCLVRRVRAAHPVTLHLTPNPAAILTPAAPGWLYEIPPGAFYYGRYPFPRPVCYRLAWRGAVHARGLEDGRLELTCEAGESWLLIAGGPEYPQVVEHIEALLDAVPTGADGEARLEATRAYWRAFTAERTPWEKKLPKKTPQRARLLQAIDDVAVLIKTQQSNEGGVLAGHNYHMCYVRDQYGTSRGLLAMGHVAEARKILAFYWDIWQRYGRIYNAQAAGLEGSFHIHENDEVEITGYLIRQAFDLFNRDGDETFLNQIFPMLAWAWEAQKRHLIGGMLPFNGDETYVAGGILPRSALNDGSAEATLLFAEVGKSFLGLASRQPGWGSGRFAMELGWLAEVIALYRYNFWVDGQLVANHPARAAEPGGSPRFRHGVCERCMDEGHFQAIGWTERSASGRYLCPRCLAEGPYEPAQPRRYFLQSVSLTPLYFGSKIFSHQELRPVVDAILDAYHRTGCLPSRPDDERGVAVGYDYGFLLYALTELKHPAALELYEKTLSLVDSTGAWVEYYINHQPSGTRCRPWESAINLEALLHYALKK